jgi:hypothetical protein
VISRSTKFQRNPAPLVRHNSTHDARGNSLADALDDANGRHTRIHAFMTARTRAARGTTPKKVDEKVAPTRADAVSEKDAATTTTTEVATTTPVTPAVVVEDSAVEISRATSEEPEAAEDDTDPNAKRAKVSASARSDSDFESPEDAGAVVDSQDSDWQPEESASQDEK